VLYGWTENRALLLYEVTESYCYTK